MTSFQLRLAAVSLAVIAPMAACSSSSPGSSPGPSGNPESSAPAAGGTSELAAAGTTCADFASGSAPPVTTIHYTVDNVSITKISPPSVAYWVKVVPSKGGLQAYTITESTDKPVHVLFLGVGGVVFDNFVPSARSCAQVSSVLTHPSGPVVVSFTAVAGTTYYVGVQYHPVWQIASGGSSASVTARFTTTGASGSMSQLELVSP